MSVKMTGKEFKAFYDDPAVWGDNKATAPDSVISIDGVEVDDWDMTTIADEAIVKVLSGYMEDAPAGVPESFAGAARWWLKRQATATLVIECHKDKLEAVKAAIKAAGGKVL